MKAFVSLPRGAVFDTFFTPDNIALAEQLGEIVWNDTGHRLSEAELAERIGNCDVCISGWGSPALTPTVLDSAPRLRLLTHLCGTVVPFVTPQMWERGIRVISGNSYFADSVAEGAVAYMLAALRDIPTHAQALKQNKQWKSAASFNNRGLRDRTVGVVSYGTIARRLVKLLYPFGVHLKVYDIVPVPGDDLEHYGMVQTTLEDIFSSCDIITLHTAGTPETRHMVDDRLLSMIGNGALLVNTARGALIDEAALCRQLATGRFSAVLDVYEKEPPAPDSPLYTLPNVMMMPHMAGPTVDRRQVITRDLLGESADFIDRGIPPVHEISRREAGMMSAK